MRIPAHIFFLVIILTLTPNLRGQIILNEIMFNPPGNENHNEFIELLNTGIEPVDLSGWNVSDQDGSDEIVGTGGGLVLLPGQYAIILDSDYFLNSTVYDTFIPGAALILTINGPTLGSRGLSNSNAETISLISSTGDTVTSYRYSPGNPDGISDEKIIPNIMNNAENWADSKEIPGSPGARNSVTPPDFDLSVTSLNADPPYPHAGQSITFSVTVRNNGIHTPSAAAVSIFFDADKNGLFTMGEILDEFQLDVAGLSVFGDSVIIEYTWLPPTAGTIQLSFVVSSTPDEAPGNNIQTLTLSIPDKENQLKLNEIMYQPLSDSPEWIEIVNTGSSEINLDNWLIKDKIRATPAVISESHVIIQPGEFIVLTGDSSRLAGKFTSTFAIIEVDDFPALNNDEDEITLAEPSGKISDKVDYNSSWGSNRGVSLERILIEGPSNSRMNWGLSTDPAGATPGKPNTLSISGIPSNIIIVPDPNPFSPTRRSEVCSISVSHPLTQSLVTMKIYDRYGRLIRDLLRGELRGSVFSVTWDGKNNNGRLMLTDIYVVYFNAQSTLTGENIEYKTTVVLVN